MAAKALRPCVTALAALLVHSAAPLGAADGDPLSAIGWLSDSISLPEDGKTGLEITPANLPPEISVMALGSPVPDRAGLLDAVDFGLNAGIWGRSSAADLAAAIAALPSGAGAAPSLRRFIRDLMVLRLDPPIDAMVDDSLYLARLDRLLAMGHLDAAQALIDGAGGAEPRRFRRAFDVALLHGGETNACMTIEATPDISPTYMARIFCLARLGKWDVAALTLGNAKALGILTPDEDKLLAHFLDPELFEAEPVPTSPRLPSPLVFRLYEAVGERISTDQLPVAFAAADMTDTVGWKTRLRAAERLAAADVLSFETLMLVFSEREAAASGGVWERVKALQALDAALHSKNANKVAVSLPPAWSAAREIGYEASFAEWLAPMLGSLDLDGPAGHLAFEVALLAGDPDMAEGFSGETREDQFLLSLARGQSGAPAGPGQLDHAVLRGMSAINPGATYEALIRDDRQGEALLRALEQLIEGAGGNPNATTNSLALLRTLGLEALATQIAVELILMEGAA